MGLFNRKSKPKPQKIQMPCALNGINKFHVPITYAVKKQWPLIVLERTHHHVLTRGTNKIVHSDGTDFAEMPEGVYMLEEFCSLEEFVSTDDE